MSNAKLSALTSAAFAGGDLVYIVQGGNSRKATIGARAAALLDDTGETQALTTLGGTTVGRSLFRAVSVAAALTALNVSAFAQTYLDDTGATTFRSTTGTNNATNLTTGTLDTGRAPLTYGTKMVFQAGVVLNESAAPTTSADQGALYTKNSGTQTELYFREESSGDEVQITSNGVLRGIVLGTALASTSGTAVNFTGIPSGVKQITISLDAVSTNGTSGIQVQIGDAGGLETTGYISTGSNSDATAIAASGSTAGFFIRNGSATVTSNGSIILTLHDPTFNTWCAQGLLSGSSGSTQYYVSGKKVLSATLDRISLVTVNGTDTFDAGSVNIAYQ